MAFAETQKLVVELDLKGNLKAGLRDAARAIQGFDKATSNTQRSLSKLGGNIQKGIVVGAAAAAGAIGTVVKAASDYESAFAGVRKTVNATEPELKALSDAFRSMSKEIPISASELARLGEAGGALGVPTKQLKEFVRVTALLGVTTNLSADEAANSLGILGNVLHLTGEEYSKFASSLVALGNAGASTEADIVAIAERAGAAGALIGVATEDILGFASATASLGIEAEAGGTALQKFFIDSAKMIAGGGKDLQAFAKVAGVSTKAFAKAFKDDAGAALQDFLAGLGKLPQAQQLKVLEDLGFNDARITRTLLGLANNTKLVGDQMTVANKAFAENTALTKEADQRFNTFESQLQITKNTLTDMAITIGSKLLPKITPLLKRLNEFIGTNTAGIEKFGDNLASGFEKVADALQKVDWQPFIDGLKLSADIAGKVIGIFRSLPEGLQAALIGGFALNKLTGGLGTSIAKDIGGALVNQFAARGSNPANPLFVMDVAGGGGALGALGKGGGLLALGKTLLTTVAIPAVVGLFLAGKFAGVGPFADNKPMNRISGVLGRTGPQPGGTERQEALLGATLAQTKAAEMNARRIEAAENRTGMIMNSAGEALRAQLPATVLAFRAATKQLAGAKGPEAIAAAIKSAMTSIFTKGQGGSGGAANVLAALKSQLKNTHDPRLAATLRSAIARVEHKLAARRIVEAQLKKADQIYKSNLTNAQKIEQLKAVQRAIGNRNVIATKRVQDKIDAAKRAQVKATNDAKRAIQSKDFSVAVKNIINIAAKVSLKGTTTAQAIQNNYYNVPS